MSESKHSLPPNLRLAFSNPGEPELSGPSSQGWLRPVPPDHLYPLPPLETMRLSTHIGKLTANYHERPRETVAELRNWAEEASRPQVRAAVETLHTRLDYYLGALVLYTGQLNDLTNQRMLTPVEDAFYWYELYADTADPVGREHFATFQSVLAGDVDAFQTENHGIGAQQARKFAEELRAYSLSDMPYPADPFA